MLQTLLNDVWRELFPAQNKQRAKKLAANPLVYLNAFELKNILNNVVSIRVLHKDLCMLCDFKREVHLLLWISAVNALLHHTTTMFVTGNLLALLDHCIIDKLIELWLPSLKYFLYDMIAIYIFSELSYSIFQEWWKKFNMLRFLDDLNDLLNWASAMSMSA